MNKTEEERAENPQVIVASITQCLARSYDITGRLFRLPGENYNYLVDTSKDEKYVVKLAADDQSESFVQMEYLALQQASVLLPDIQFPQIVENKFGNAETFLSFEGNCDKRLRLIRYLSGTLLEGSDISEECRFNVGKTLARFDHAMEDFDHPAAHRLHRWDLTQAAQYQSTLELINDAKKQHQLSWAFTNYANINTGKTDQVIWQFIHGDANPENILVDEGQVVGLLDFGDSCFNPRICELAICLPYLMMGQDDPVAAAKPVIDGYQSFSPLSKAELDLLWPLVLGRIATTISVATQRRQLDADHPNWFVSEDSAWQLLGQLWELPELFL
jgi:Ser/Thr protein kinase RdoA (MazF antagonist)